MEPYYYQRLSKPMQEAYHAIKRGGRESEPSLPGTSAGDGTAK